MFILAVLLILCSSTIHAYFLEEECLNYTIYPVQYDLTIIPHIFNDGTAYFDCDLLITVISNAPNVNIIELDAKDIEIKNGIKVLNGIRADIVNQHRPYEFDNKRGKLYIYLKEPIQQYSLSKTQYVIRISYVKYVNTASDGVFIVPYEEAGKSEYFYTTRLSPNKAKYFFPCFDNPQFEAIFKFRVYVTPPRAGIQFCNTTVVIANELKRESFKDDSYGIIEYIPSPQIGVYQVGFHHSNFANRQIKAYNDTIVIWAPRSTHPYYTFILQFSESIINLIHQYSKMNRPLVNGPINIVSVPKSLNGYEIGSWNLLTNSDIKLSNINEYTSIKQTESAMLELAQQLSRIWLGNPGEVERTRWKEEWFKEGVATYFAYYYLTQHNNGEPRPNHRLPLTTHGLHMKHRAMSVDWHHTTPALITFNRTLAIEIPSRYKELVMMKTASLLWMVENWLGSQKFHQAMINYINTRRGRYISLNDFMASLDRDTVECLNQFFNGSTASRVLNSWFYQSGYPVVDVKVLRDRTPNAIQLKQRKFSFNELNRFESNFLIPVSYIVQNNENCYNCHKPRFTIGSQTYTFGENLNGGWIILNRNASGYYRVNYDEDTWRLIAKTLRENHLSIDELNRAQIVNDIFALYAAGDVTDDVATDVLGYLTAELSPAVWGAAVAGFDMLKTEGGRMTKILYEEWQNFMQKKVSTIYRRLMDDIEQRPTIRLFRSNIIEFACAIKHRACWEDMRRVDRRRGEGGRMHPDLRLACYHVALSDVTGNMAAAQLHNNFERDDATRAEHKIREHNRFIYRVPNGNPKPLPIIMSTRPPPTTEVIPSSTSAVQCGGSENALASLLTVILLFTINMILK